MMTGGWLKNIAQWKIGKTLYLSVPFTWLLPKALKLAQAHRGPVLAGGPAVDLMPDYLAGTASIGNPCPVAEPLIFHNPLATCTSRGCPNRCSFCAINTIEGDFRELKGWRPAPIVCDNNLLAASKKHFDRVIDSLKPFPFVDFNQGLEARRLKPYHARRLAELKKVKVRFAFDSLKAEKSVLEAITLCRQHGLKVFGVYVLIGFKDTPDDAHYRLEKVREWGIRPSPMRFQPLNALSKNSFVAPEWDERTLKDTMRYYSRLVWLGHFSFAEYCGRATGTFDKAA
jgi:hypothetical protein